MDYAEVFKDALLVLAVVVIAILLLAGLVRLLFRNLTGDDLKLYLDFLKWATVSVALVIVTNIVDSIMKDREAGLNELKQYDKYVDLVIQNDEIAKKWRLAQYYAAVTPSNKLRARWNDYYKIVEGYYKDSLAQQAALQKTRDSLVRLAEFAVDSSKYQIEQKLNFVSTRLQGLNTQLNPNLNQTSNADSATFWEEKGFNYLFQKDVVNAIAAFNQADIVFPTFHSVSNIRGYLQEHKAALQTGQDPEWRAAYKMILTNWSWRLSNTQLQRLKELSK